MNYKGSCVDTTGIIHNINATTEMQCKGCGKATTKNYNGSCIDIKEITHNNHPMTEIIPRRLKCCQMNNPSFFFYIQI